MSEVVLDASVVLKWFHAEDEEHLEKAVELRRRFEAGDLDLFAPPLLWLEIVNVAARRWRWPADRLEEFALQLPLLGFEILEPDLDATTSWTAAGLTAYDAAYVAVAEETEVPLITDDADIIEVAPEIATPLSAFG